MSTTETKRDGFIDFLKGIAIIFVLWGHAIQYSVIGETSFFDNAVFMIIYSFHMSFFMLISGYVFRWTYEKRDLKNLIVRRSQTLLQPIIICGIIYYYSTFFLRGLPDGFHGVILSAPWMDSLGGY